MPDYKKMYFALFNAVTNSISNLQKAQQDGEKAYIEEEAVPLSVIVVKPKKKKQIPKA